MTEKYSGPKKKQYQPPEVTDYGDLREVTKGSHGPNQDMSGGMAGSRQ